MGAQTQTGSGDDSTKNEFGMANAHAYTVLGTYVAGGVNLIKMRNPWRAETYTGKWNDNDPAWTSAMKSVVKFDSNKEDGIFFIEDRDFVNAFEKFVISDYMPNGKISWYQVEGDTKDNEKVTYSFNLPTKGDMYVSVDTWNHRMYPGGCIDGNPSTI